MTTRKHQDSIILVQPPHTTDTVEGESLVEPTTYETIHLENRFGGDDCTNGGVRELKEIPIKIVPDDQGVDDPSGFDVCREYGYKYEYAQDFPEDQEEDRGEEVSNVLPSSLNQTTAVISKTQERIPYIHVLGKTYHPIHDYHERRTLERSLFWFTYRCDFPQIAPYGIDSDAGWGCMLRSAQMLLGHTLRIHFKSRNWRPPPSTQDSRRDDFVRTLLTWFADFPSKAESVYSIHNMVAAGYAKYQTLPGEWWGPGTACYVIRDLVELHQKTQPSLFRVHVSAEGTVYRDAVFELMTRDSKKRAEERKRQKEECLPSPLHPLDPAAASSPEVSMDSLEWDTSLLLLIPLRIGLDRFNEKYVQSVARSFWLPQSVGILGGRPRGARWFYGAYADGSKVLGLDPHTVQAAPKRNGLKKVQLCDQYLESVHTNYPEVYDLKRMDPSFAVGFYCRDRRDFASLEASLEQLKMSPNHPDLFTIADKAPDYSSSALDDMLGSSNFDDDGAAERSDDDEDEYVLL
eukprot:Nitzschia sp. Nitz4//scaffold19_size178191//2246//3799//NITZ4_001950-RA/size178191-processed-gene-0.43-mRNA-1//-1//CDS//3329540598//4714//frame0